LPAEIPTAVTAASGEKARKTSKEDGCGGGGSNGGGGDGDGDPLVPTGGLP